MTLPEKMSLDEERVVFFHALGAALAEWALLENALLVVVKSCLGKNARLIVGVGFVSIVGFHSKLKFADEAVIRALHLHRRDEEREAWAAIIKRLQRQSDKRNELAHFQTREFPGNNVEGERVALCPWKFLKTWDKKAPAPDCLCIMKIVRARLEFEALRRSLDNFLARLVAQPEPHPKSRERADSPPTIRQLRLQIHGALGAPHLSSREIQAYESAAAAAASLRTQQGDEEPRTISDRSGGKAES